MTDNAAIGPMSMVKIDGSKIKQLREQQGLTQLYLATAVEVTTDTISRWENRRYPSIKRDNGLKLAEALNVSLDDLLESDSCEEEAISSSPTETRDLNEIGQQKKSASSSRRHLFTLLGVCSCILFSLSWYLFFSSSSTNFSVERIVPAHCISNQKFPVIILVTGAPDTATALIVKESLSKNGTIHSTSPAGAAGGPKNNQIKWLSKIEDSARYAYIASVKGKEEETVKFAGTAAFRGNSESLINGRNSIIIGHHHWADSNRDNIISDAEILAVYDQYTGITDIELDIDLIEEIWMGSEYLWDSRTATYKIID